MERLKEIPIEGADFQYFGSTLGKIYKWDGNILKELKGWLHYQPKWGKSYRRYGIKVNGKPKNMYGQRLILLAFVGPPYTSNRVARHGKGGPLDNRPENLKWGSHEENQNKDRKRAGNYHNRGRKKPIPSEPDPSDENFWEVLAERSRAGCYESIEEPF
jgi:hypothetical protein